MEASRLLYHWHWMKGLSSSRWKLSVFLTDSERERELSLLPSLLTKRVKSMGEMSCLKLRWGGVAYHPIKVRLPDSIHFIRSPFQWRWLLFGAHTDMIPAVMWTGSAQKRGWFRTPFCQSSGIIARCHHSHWVPVEQHSGWESWWAFPRPRRIAHLPQAPSEHSIC